MSNEGHSVQITVNLLFVQQLLKAHNKKDQSLASLAFFCEGNPWWPVDCLKRARDAESIYMLCNTNNDDTTMIGYIKISVISIKAKGTFIIHNYGVYGQVNHRRKNIKMKL